MFHSLLQSVREIKLYLQLPAAVKAEIRNDRLGLPLQDPGIEQGIDWATAWVCLAQDSSISHDGGVAGHYSLINGWSASYPETTGYIIPTMLEYAKLRQSETIRRRAKAMLDWLVSIQLSCGGFQGGMIDSRPIVPVTFNTGQILLGLASGVREFGSKYFEPMLRAADWLVETQDSGGCWRKYPSPFAAEGEKAYETHVAWGLLEAGSIAAQKKYTDAALANIHWALKYQKENGWFAKCCLTNSAEPLTHTLGYVLRGLLEGFRFTQEPMILNACIKTANGLVSAIHENGFLPGRLNSEWQGTVSWACLTGTAQIAYCWLRMHQLLDNIEYRNAAYAANLYVRRSMKISGAPQTAGGIKGSFPINGSYGQFAYLNCASKFFIDASIAEKALRHP